jgi:UDP-N-acetylmuramate--alanine ligase
VGVLFLLDIYSAGETPIPGADSRSLCRAIRMRGKVDPIFVEHKEDINSLLKGVVKENDIIAVLGAGDVGSIAPALMHQFGGR